MIGLFFHTSTHAMTSYVTSSRPQFFLHFPGSGGTSIHAFALALYSRNSTRWNNGCHAEQFSWRAALRAQDRGRSTARRCTLDSRLYEGAQALFERRMASLPRDNR